MENNQSPSQWERKTIEKLAFEALAEQRRRRRWGIFFKILGFAYATVLLWQVVDWGISADSLAEGKHYSALVEMKGVISADGEANAEDIVESLTDAFKHKATQGVILRINSPGGSPVQSGIINDGIARLRAKYPDKPLYAVVEDVCASGGYYVAVAADKIFVDKASIVGSIGVLMDGFGFTGSMEKLGVERRLLTAGENKGFLDPFSPQDAKHLEHARVLLGDIHKQFIEVVRKGRGQRLKETPELFSGLMWTGAQSVELGLADGFGSTDYVAREIIKAEDIKDFTVKQTLADRFARRFGAGATQAVAQWLGAVRLR